MSARALHAFTDLLPLVELPSSTCRPAALGTSTVEAMQSGLFWGALGTIRELVAQLTAGLSTAAASFSHRRGRSRRGRTIGRRRPASSPISPWPALRFGRTEDANRIIHGPGGVVAVHIMEA